MTGTGRTARVTYSSLFPELQTFSRKATLKGWTVPQRNSSQHLAGKFNFILLIYLLKELFLGKFLLMKRPYKS